MKYFFLICLIFTLLSCQDDSLPGGIRFLDEQEIELLKRPTDVLSFKIDGVPDANIRFISLDKHQPIYNRIHVKLPENYAGGDKIVARVKIPEGYVIRDYSRREYDPGNFELDFAKTDALWLSVHDKKNDRTAGDFYIYVDPSQPIVAPSRMKKYEDTLGRDGIYIFVPLENLGTASTIDANDVLLDRVTADIRNIVTGKVYTGSGGYFLDNPEDNLSIAIPGEAEEGEYEITVRRKDRQVILPDRLVLNYGEVNVQVLPITTVTQNQDQMLRFDAFNLRPTYKYRLELKNDFGETQVLKPAPESHLALTCALPGNLLPGNYRADLYINDVKVISPFTLQATVIAVKSRTDQPVISLVSDEAHALYGEVTLYQGVTVLQKSQPVIADFRDAIRENAVLIFKNMETKKEYEVPILDFTPAFYRFPRFKIPVTVPVGRYEVRSRHGALLSERYQNIITLE